MTLDIPTCYPHVTVFQLFSPCFGPHMCLLHGPPVYLLVYAIKIIIFLPFEVVAFGLETDRKVQ